MYEKRDNNMFTVKQLHELLREYFAYHSFYIE